MAQLRPDEPQPAEEQLPLEPTPAEAAHLQRARPVPEEERQVSPLGQVSAWGRPARLEAEQLAAPAEGPPASRQPRRAVGRLRP